MAGLRLPPVIGHRGAAGLAPENTLAALRAAKRAGASWVEFDIRLSRDRECVVIHDRTLERIAGRPTPVSRMGLDELRRCGAGSWFSAQFADERIPGLGDVLALACGLGLGVNIELKPCGLRNHALVAALLRTLSSDRRCESLPVLISSFSPALLSAVRRRDKAMPLGLLLRRRWRCDWRAVARSLGCFSLHCAERGLEAGQVQRIREAGHAVVVYIVNDAARGHELLSWGVTSLISDVPDRLLAAVQGPLAHIGRN